MTLAHSQKGTPSTEICPECDGTIEVRTGYIKWCAHCNWNLEAFIPEPKNAFERTYAKLGARQSKYLFEQMSQEGALTPRTTTSKVLAFALATIIHLFSILTFAVGVWLILSFWPAILIMIIGVMLVIASIAVRPRLGKWSGKAKTRKEIPQLFRLVDQISDVLNAPKVDGIVLDWNFNASYGRVGWQSKQLLTIGLPLFYNLNEQERIALLGHELAHGINGDSSRGLYVGTAINTLFQWYVICLPDALWDPGTTGIVQVPINLLRLGIAHIILLFSQGLSALLWRDSQRAEYLADAIAVEIGGRDATMGLIEKLYLSKSYYVAAGRYILNPKLRKETTLFNYIESQLKAVPDTEIERIRRLQIKTESRLDVTHPPAIFRRQIMELNDTDTPKVMASTIDFDPIMNELESFNDSVQTDLINNRHMVL